MQAGPLKFTKNNNETYDIENNVEFRWKMMQYGIYSIEWHEWEIL